MHHTTPTTRLLPMQTRLINASNGVRLQVVSGHFWLTQPNAEQDLFLGPGSSVDLWQGGVVIGADARPRQPKEAPPCYSEYRLTPLAATVAADHWSHAAARSMQRWLRQAVAAARSATPRAFAK